MESKSRKLSILQYNTHKSLDGVMAPLLRDPRIRDYDILAIQEPWRSTHKNTTHRFRESGFDLAYMDHKDTRVCFFVNNRMARSDWNAHFPSPDLCTLSLKTRDGDIQVHNVYNPSPFSPRMRAVGTLETLRQQLQMPGQHIIVGDFNLHHPWWGGPSIPTQHDSADLLIEIVQEANMDLVLPEGTVTWRRKNGSASSTIDLVFVSLGLVDSVLTCGTHEELDHQSDHLPIATEVNIEWEPSPPQKRKMWKTMDSKKINEFLASQLPQLNSLPLNNTDELDNWLKAFLEICQQAITKFVRTSTPSKYSKSGWTADCSEAVAESRRAERAFHQDRCLKTWIERAKAVNRKKNTIRKWRRMHFRESVEKAIVDGKAWKLARWSRKGAMEVRETPQIPWLHWEGEEAYSNEEKARLLSKKFFPPQLEADLSDIADIAPQTAKDINQDVTKDDVLASIDKTVSDKAPGPDEIPNRFWKETADTVSPPSRPSSKNAWICPIAQSISATQ